MADATVPETLAAGIVEDELAWRVSASATGHGAGFVRQLCLCLGLGAPGARRADQIAGLADRHTPCGAPRADLVVGGLKSAANKLATELAFDVRRCRCESYC